MHDADGVLYHTPGQSYIGKVSGERVTSQTTSGYRGACSVAPRCLPLLITTSCSLRLIRPCGVLRCDGTHPPQNLFLVSCLRLPGRRAFWRPESRQTTLSFSFASSSLRSAINQPTNTSYCTLSVLQARGKLIRVTYSKSTLLSPLPTLVARRASGAPPILLSKPAGLFSCKSGSMLHAPQMQRRWMSASVAPLPPPSSGPMPRCSGTVD